MKNRPKANIDREPACTVPEPCLIIKYIST